MFEIGSTLREARERQGLELAEVEQATQIRGRYLAALEEERFELLPARAYARGFLRVYADFLGLDARLFVDEFNSRFPEAEQPEFVSARWRGTLTHGRLPRLRMLVAGALVIVLVGLLAWRFGAPPRTTVVPAPLPTRTRPHRPAVPPLARAFHHPAKTQAHLVLRARGRCWVSVRVGSATGAVLSERILAAGDVLRYTLAVGRPQLWLRIGAPWNLAVSLNRRPVTALPAGPGDIVVSRSGVRTA